VGSGRSYPGTSLPSAARNKTLRPELRRARDGRVDRERRLPPAKAELTQRREHRLPHPELARILRALRADVRVRLGAVLVCPGDVLVNNAGGSRPFKIDAGDEQWNEAMTLNVTRQRQLTHHLLDQMMARKWGRILNVTGKSEPDGINGAFCAKAAIHSWAKGLSRDVGKYGITVNCLPPGRINSEQIRRNYTPEYRQWQADNEIPVGRYGEPEDMANIICFLASPLASYITGTVIPIDGGLRRYQF
jgi:NAD(P)-dependent dehydrogenase (short-subunit alcohol dehydrogenase family)